MIQIENVKRTGAFVPQTNEEANGEILGRCNALHDWLMNEAKHCYVSSTYKEVCVIMGFADVLEVIEGENEKAGE